MKLDGVTIAQTMGAITVLAATSGTGYRLIINKLTGVLWTYEEAGELLKAAAFFDPLNERIIDDLIKKKGESNV